MYAEVSLVKCTGYEPSTVDTAVREAIDRVGGLDKFVKPGDKVLLKPNLLLAKPPEHAVTTHPEVVKAVARLVRELGATPQVGDSPGGGIRGINRVWENTGMYKLAQEIGAEPQIFERAGVYLREVNNKKYYLAKPVLDADVVINLPKLKTHNLVLLTGAVKNMFGAIPGFRKAEYHRDAPRPKQFSEILIDIFSLVRPQITILDAVVAMEGEGPAAGIPRKMNLLICSKDAVAIDTVVATLIGYDTKVIDTIQIAQKRGIGVGSLKNIRLVGDSLENFIVPDFKLPSNWKYRLLPDSIVKPFKKYIWVRPTVIKEKCKKCYFCIENCPVQAITIVDESYPEINHRKCINCLCCQELCEDYAVTQVTSRLAKLFM